MKIRSVALPIVAIVSLALFGCSKESEQATEPPAISPEQSVVHSEYLKQTKARLLGKWTISADATKAVPIDTVKYPWMPEKLDSLIKEGISWEFSEDGTVIGTFGSHSESEGYRILQDEAGDVWIAMTSYADWDLHRAKLSDGFLHLTPVGRDHTDEEIPIVGTLVLSKGN